ncbi:MAG: DUF4179 domain-containing protein [Dehalococcoidales bacterium]|nr:DUF4179 domain-containing protein [Dehalococcoidales bacterium]
MDRTEFEQDLQGFFHNEADKVKHSEGWWNKVVLMATGEKPVYTAPKSGFFRRKLFLIPLAVILALTVTGGTVYGYSSLLKEVIGGMVPSVENEETGESISLAWEYNLSQTIDGVTASLEYAYADINKVVVGISVKGEKYFAVSLYNANGQELADGPIGLGSANGDWVWTFDTPDIDGNPSSLNLRIEISISKDKEPFIFEFEVPYYDGKVVNVGQMVEAAGVRVELESLLISPSETRAIFYISPQTDEQGSYASLLLEVLLPDGTLANSNMGSGNNPIEDAATKYINGDFTAQYGEWVITVTELVYTPPIDKSKLYQIHAPSDTVRLAGPWVFTVWVE